MTAPLRLLAAAGLALAGFAAGVAASAMPANAERPAYGWLATVPARDLAGSFPPPEGHVRIALAPGSFGHWLRHLPLKPEGAPVMLFDGRPRADQSGAAAIVDIDVGRRDLQQCADAVIRLRAEWLHAAGRRDRLAFAFTSGDRYAYADWLRGRTPMVSDSRVAWHDGARRADDRAGLRRWLDIVFAYAGSISLQRELAPVADIRAVAPGDVLIQGGSPGHAVIVLDVARDSLGNPAVLLAQSYMPAQSLHVLRNPAGGVWYFPADADAIATPDWRFLRRDLRRFPDPD